MTARILVPAAAALLMAAEVSGAYDLTPNASLMTIYTDNASRSAGAGRSATVLDTAAGLQFLENSDALVADVSGKYLYRYYVNDVLPSERLPNVVGTVTWNIVPKYVSWLFEDEYGQVAPSPFFALSPAGQQDVNYATTGPSVNIPFWRAESFRIGGTYSTVNYQDSNTDYKGASAYASLAHTFSKFRELSVNYVRERVDFRHSDLYPDYVEQSGFVRLSSNVHVMSLLLDAGAASIESAPGQRYTRVVGDLTVYRQVGAITTVGVDIGQRFSDSAEAFRFDQLAGTLGSSSANVSVSATPYVEQNGSLFASIGGRRQTLTVSVSHEMRNLVGPVENHQRIDYAELSDEYRINPLDSFSAELRFEQDLNRTAAGELKVSYLSAGLQYVHSLTRDIRLTVSLDRYEARLAGAFNEDRVGLYLSYSPQPKTPRAALAPYRGRGVPLPPSLDEAGHAGVLTPGGVPADAGSAVAQ